MNSLSWFIYLTQVVQNVSFMAGSTLLFVGIFGGLACAALTVIRFADVEEHGPQPDHPLVIAQKKWTKRYIGLMLAAVVVVVVVPERRTMLMIAGSEMGERITKSDAVQSVVDPGMDLIRTWIKKEAEKLKADGGEAKK